MGRDPSDRWWALLGWVGYLRYNFRGYTAVCSGWVPADDVMRLDDTRTTTLSRRYDLALNRQHGRVPG